MIVSIQSHRKAFESSALAGEVITKTDIDAISVVMVAQTSCMKEGQKMATVLSQMLKV